MKLREESKKAYTAKLKSTFETFFIAIAVVVTLLASLSLSLQQDADRMYNNLAEKGLKAAFEASQAVCRHYKLSAIDTEEEFKMALNKEMPKGLKFDEDNVAIRENETDYAKFAFSFDKSTDLIRVYFVSDNVVPQKSYKTSFKGEDYILQVRLDW